MPACYYNISPAASLLYRKDSLTSTTGEPAATRASLWNSALRLSSQAWVRSNINITARLLQCKVCHIDCEALLSSSLCLHPARTQLDAIHSLPGSRMSRRRDSACGASFHSRVQGSSTSTERENISEISCLLPSNLLFYISVWRPSNCLYITVLVPGAVLFRGRCRLELLALQSLPPNFHSNYRGRDELETSWSSTVRHSAGKLQL